MALKEELESAVQKILRDQWQTRNGRVVPELTDLLLGNDGISLEATVLYADMAGSTGLVDNYPATFAAEIYKCGTSELVNMPATVTMNWALVSMVRISA